MTFKPDKIKKIINNLNQRRQEIRARKDEAIPEKDSESAKDEEKAIPSEAATGKRRNRNKKGKKKKKSNTLVKLKKKEKEAEVKINREIREAISTMEELIIITRDEQAKFRLSYKPATPLQEMYSSEYLGAQDSLADACKDILEGLKQREPDILEASFPVMKERKKAVQRTKILKRVPGDSNAEFEGLRAVCLDILEDKADKDALSSPLENLKKYIDEMDQGNQREFEKIEEPGLAIKEMFENFNSLVEKYRGGVETVASYNDKNEKEKIVRGLFIMKEADEGIEEMLG